MRLKERLRSAFHRISPPKEKREVPETVSKERMNPRSLSFTAMEIIAGLSEIGPRLSLSKEERMAANRVSSLLSGYGLEPGTASFRASNTGEKAVFRIIGMSLPVTVLLIAVGEPFFALVLSVLVSLEFWFDVVKEKGFISRFLKKGTGVNVSARLEPATPCERIIFTSHLDSARIMKGDGKNALVYLSAATLMLSSFLSFAMTIYELVRGRLFAFGFNFWVNLFVTLPLFVMAVFSSKIAFIFSDKVSPGVGDNLTGVGIETALAGYFSVKRPENIALEFAYFSSEETGKAGSRDFFSKHDRDGSVVINIDGFYNSEDLAVLMSDGNGLVELSEPLALSLQALSEKMGWHMKTGRLGFLGGSTDAVSAALQGFEATTLTTMVPGSGNPGHTEKDTIGYVDRAVLESVIAVLIRYVEDRDGSYTSRIEKKEEESFLSSGMNFPITRT